MNDLKPMVALNVYLTGDFLKEVLTTAWDRRNELSSDIREHFNSQIKEKLKVPGFRNPTVAPKALVIRAMETLFVKESSFVSSVLSAWAESAVTRADGLEPVLRELGFEIVDPAARYMDVENSFQTGWPDGVTFDALFSTAQKKLPHLGLTSDELALLTIIKTGSLPGEPAEG